MHKLSPNLPIPCAPTDLSSKFATFPHVELRDTARSSRPDLLDLKLVNRNALATQDTAAPFPDTRAAQHLSFPVARASTCRFCKSGCVQPRFTSLCASTSLRLGRSLLPTISLQTCNITSGRYGRCIINLSIGGLALFDMNGSSTPKKAADDGLLHNEITPQLQLKIEF